MSKGKILTLVTLFVLSGNAFAKKRNFKITHNKKGHKGKLWTYSGEFGPSNWSKIDDDFSDCRKGKEQSPINISGLTEGDHKPLIFKYRVSNVNVINNSHTFFVPYDKGSVMQVDDETYFFKNMSFHAPSEHRMHGSVFAMEIELYHENDSGDKAIVSVLVKNGRSNPVLQQIFFDAPKNPGEKRYFPNERLMASKLLPKNKEYFYYAGSLSYPPCTEDVKRYVLRYPITASKRQISEFKKYFRENRREVQSMNGRIVTY